MRVVAIRRGSLAYRHRSLRDATAIDIPRRDSLGGQGDVPDETRS